MKILFKILLIIVVSFKVSAQKNIFNTVDSLLLKGNYKSALRLLEKQPKSLQTFDKTASIYQATGNYAKAILQYKKALEIDSLSVLKVKLGNVYNLSGLKSNALAVFEEIIKKDSSNLLVLNSLGKLYLSKFQPKKAEKIYSYLKRKDSLNPNYPFQLAKAFSNQRKFLKMGQSYLDTYNLDTLHIKSIYELAKFFKKLRYKDSTRLFIDKGLKINNNSINFNQLKANELYFNKNFTEAIKYLSKLDSLNFKSVNTYEMFGMCYYNLKDYDEAEKYFKKALHLEYSNPNIAYRLASLYYDKKNNKLAEIYLMQSIMFSKPDLDKQYFLLGIIANEKDDLKRAVTYFDKAFKNNFKNHKALFQLALASDAYYKDKKIALKQYQKYLERFKEKDKAMYAFAKIRIGDIKKEFFLKGEKVEK